MILKVDRRVGGVLFLECSLYLLWVFFPEFSFFTVPHRGQVVDRSVLEHGQEDEHKTDPEVNIHSFDVGYPGHGGIDPSDNGGHGEHCGNT